MFTIPSGFSFDSFPSNAATVLRHERIDANTERVTLSAAAELCDVDRFGVRLSFRADAPQIWKECAESFHFIPNIKQTPEHIAGAHVFRSPAVILSDGVRVSALIPDLSCIGGDIAGLCYLDLRFAEKDDAPPFVEYGLVKQTIDGHRYYKPTGETLSLPAGTALSFYILTCEGTAADALRFITDFIFSRFGAGYTSSVLPQTVPFDTYALYGNALAEELFYREESCGGGIRLTGFSRADGLPLGREYADDQWFHTWFNNMRTAHELYHYGLASNRPQWLHMARSTVRLLLSAPQNDGLFPTIYAPHDGGWISSSLQGGGPGFFSLPDCAWTAYWLLRYQRECEPTEGADGFLKAFADGLCNRMQDRAVLPTWVENDAAGAHENRLFTQADRKKLWFLFEDDTSLPTQRLVRSTSSALPMWFLAEYAPHKDTKYAAAARACADCLIEEFLPTQRFEDFELYYSCSKKREGFYDPISRMSAQNTLAMQWCAGGLLAVWKLFGEPRYLRAARYCADLMTLYQQVWNTPTLSLYTFGGFGVMNTDSEWNDARQAQLAETLADFYEATGETVYLQRAVAAARAAFALVAMKENAAVSPNTYEGLAFLLELHGASSENYGHCGFDARAYQSGFHWGTGSALVTAAKLTNRYGDLLIDGDTAIGIDGVAVKSVVREGDTLRLELDTLPQKCGYRVVMRNGSTDCIIADGFAYDRKTATLRRIQA